MSALISFRSFSDELRKLAAEEHKVPIADVDLRIFKKLSKDSPVKVRIVEEAKHYGGGYFDMINKEIGLSEQSFAVLAHELGHAHVDQHILGRLLQNPLARLPSQPGIQAMAAYGAGVLIAKGKRWGLLLPAALSAPTIISEMLATHKGGKLLEEAGASEEQQKYYRDKLRSGLASYLVAPAAATVGGGLFGASLRQPV